MKFSSVTRLDQLAPAIPESARPGLQRYLRRLEAQAGAQVVSVLLYGSLARGEYVEGRSNVNLLVVTSSCSWSFLETCSALTRSGRQDGIVPPFVMSEQELAEYARWFPVEYVNMKLHHHLLAGTDVIASVHIDDHSLLGACRRELAGTVLRVRQRVIEGSASPEALHSILPLSLVSVVACLRGLWHTQGRTVGRETPALLSELSSALDLSEQDVHVFLEVWEIKRGLRTPGVRTLPQLMERYLTGLEALSRHVDGLTA